MKILFQQVNQSGIVFDNKDFEHIDHSPFIRHSSTDCIVPNCKDLRKNMLAKTTEIIAETKNFLQTAAYENERCMEGLQAGTDARPLGTKPFLG